MSEPKITLSQAEQLRVNTIKHCLLLASDPSSEAHKQIKEYLEEVKCQNKLAEW